MKSIDSKVAKLKNYLDAGYEVDRLGRLIHNIVYTQAYGPLPKGWHVHHIDGNVKNNTPNNLIAKPKGPKLKTLVKEIDLGLTENSLTTNKKSISSWYR